MFIRTFFVFSSLFLSNVITLNYDNVNSFNFCRRMSDTTFDNFRLTVVFLCCVLRFVFTKVHLQVFLDVAKQKVGRMKKEAGRISNITLQKKVSWSIFPEVTS